MNDNSLIRDIGRSYIVSSLLPAGLFVSLGFLFFRNFITLDFITSKQPEPFSMLPWIILSTSIVWVAFALYSIIDFTIQLYEGYYFPQWLQKILILLFVLPRHRRKMRNINESLQLTKVSPREISVQKKKMISQAHADYFNIETTSPLREEDLLSTRLGNVMKASEVYSGERFGFNGLVFWPRLSTILPENIHVLLEEKNNHLMFLLNSSLLSYVNGIIAAVACISYYVVEKYPEVHKVLSNWGLLDVFDNGFRHYSPIAFALLGGAWIIAGYIIYRLSISTAENFGLLVRTSFDLYRLDLLKQFNHPLPNTLQQEQETWKKLNEFIVNAGRLGTVPLEFEYALRADLKDPSVSKSIGD